MSIPANKTLERLLDFSALKQKVIGRNIANLETKDYKRRDVEFKAILENSINDISGVQKKQSEFQVKIDEKSEVIADGNNVEINREMADLAQNTIMFKFASKKIHGYYQSLQSVIRGR